MPSVNMLDFRPIAPFFETVELSRLILILGLLAQSVALFFRYSRFVYHHKPTCGFILLPLSPAVHLLVGFRGDPGTFLRSSADGTPGYDST